MRVLLINPLSGYYHYDPMPMPPLGLLIIAAKLRDEGHEVVFIDRNAGYFRGAVIHPALERKSIEELDQDLVSALGALKPELVGITLMTCQLRDVRRITALIRSTAGRDVVILAGGCHPTCEPESIFSDVPQLNAIVRGQGEHAIASIAGRQDLDVIPGVSYPIHDDRSTFEVFYKVFSRRKRKPVAVKHNPREPSSRDRIFTALPARDLIDTAYYQREGDSVISCYYFKRPASIITSQGCPKRCSFCASRIMEPRFFFRPHQSMMEEIEHMVEVDGVTGLFFYDINFAVHRKRTEAFTSAMISTGLSEKVKWIACAAAANLPYGLLPAMRRAGCIGLVFGFESASQKILDILNKDTDVALNQKAVDACKANDIRPQSGFIIGVPGETEDDIMLSLDFIGRNELLSSLNVLLPLPGTELNRRLVSEGRLDPADPDYWGLISDTNAPLTAKRVHCDIPFERFVQLYEYGTQKVCASTWKTLYADDPPPLLGQPQSEIKNEPGTVRQA